MEMTDDISKEISELKRRLAELEAKQSAQEPPTFVRREPMPKIDYTEGFRMPIDAAQKMAAVVPDVKREGFNPHAHGQTKPTVGQPGGFGPAGDKWPKGPTKISPKERLEVPKQPWTGWTNPNK